MTQQWYLLKDSDGKKSVSYTMMVSTFLVCTLWLMISVFAKLGGLEVREFDAGGASVWFAPIAILYFGRRWQTKDDLVKAAVDAEKNKTADEGDPPA